MRPGKKYEKRGRKIQYTINQCVGQITDFELLEIERLLTVFLGIAD